MKIQCKASLIIVAEEIIERETLSEQTEEPPSDLIVNRASEKKVSFILHLPRSTEHTSPLLSSNLMIRLSTKMVRTNSERT